MYARSLIRVQQCFREPVCTVRQGLHVIKASTELLDLRRIEEATDDDVAFCVEVLELGRGESHRTHYT
jgi:hypothetical protein